MLSPSAGRAPALVLLLAAAASAGPIRPPRYTVTSLGERREAADINDAGQVVGVTFPIGGNVGSLGFVYDSAGPLAGTFREFEAFGDPSRGWTYGTSAVAINASGQVVGAAAPGPPGSGMHAYLADGPTILDLGSLSGPSGSSNASDVNDSGTVVGVSSGPGPNVQAFLYRDGVMHALGTLGGRTIASDVNNLGQVVGGSEIDRTSTWGVPVEHAFLSDGDPSHPLTDLGTLGGDFSHATAINDRGQVVGEAQTAAGKPHPFLYQPGVGMTDIGTASAHPDEFGTASDINDAGQVVGRISGPRASELVGSFATLYDQGTLYDLNDLADLPVGWLLTEAMAINNLGQIVARAHVPDGDPSYGRSASVLLTPDSRPAPTPPPVPEPTALAVLLAAIAGRAAFRSRRRPTPGAGGQPA